MTNTDTSQAKAPSKPDYSHVNEMNVRFLKDYKEICAKLRAEGRWFPRTRRFGHTNTPFDREMLTIRLKPASYMGLLDLIEFAAMFRRLQSIAGRLDQEKRKWLEDNLGYPGEWLARCNASYCEFEANAIERLVNRTLRPYDVLQHFKWDTDPDFNAFLDTCRKASTVTELPNGKGRIIHMHLEPLNIHLKSLKEKEKDDSAGTTPSQD